MATRPSTHKISMSKGNTNNGNEYMNITLEDTQTGEVIFNGEMSLEEFAKAVTGQCNVPIDEIKYLNKLGGRQ